MNLYDIRKKTPKKSLFRCDQELCEKVFLSYCGDSRPRGKGSITLGKNKKYSLHLFRPPKKNRTRSRRSNKDE